jgi:glycosyltransferase involved in cell wall biosynthesis
MILHVACLPFPSHQGTQAAIAAMLEASVQSGEPTHLLAYSQAAYDLDPSYHVHRIPDFPKVRSLRSGPSWGKVALDVKCIVEVRRLAHHLRPRAIIAHHIEAACASVAARVSPVYYVAHTDLERELPVYLSPAWASLARGVATRLESAVRDRVAGVATVAPTLARRLGGRAIHLPVPWLPSRSSKRLSRAEARSALGIAPDGPICLYAGNLDRYQGWEWLIEALSILRRTEPHARLLIATASDPGPALHEARRAGLEHAVVFRQLDGEQARASAHAASDLAWIPRRTEGGLPIKMLDAFARGLPTVAMERATAGLEVERACIVVPNDDSAALARAAVQLLDDRRTANALAAEAERYLEAHHSTESFAKALGLLLGEGDRDDQPALRAASISCAGTPSSLSSSTVHQR